MVKVLLIASLFSGLLITSITSKYKETKLIGFVLAFIFVYIISGFVTYTPDWLGYATLLYKRYYREPFYMLVQIVTLKYGYGFKQIQLLFTGLYTLFLIILISKFNKNPFLIVTLFIPIIYLFYATQIRFFLGYYSVCLSLYYFFISKKRVLALLLLIFGLINHYSLFIIFIFLFFFKYNVRGLFKKVIYVTIALFIVFSISNYLYNFILSTNYWFSVYFSKSERSSILGGVFSFMPSILSLILINGYARKMMNRIPSLFQDKKFVLLYRLSIVPYVILGIAIYVQVIGQRFIIPALLFQLLLVFYIARHYNTKKQNFNLIGLTLFYYILYFTFVYILSPIVVGNDITQKVLLMLNSNSLIGHWF